jgi:hypothetical protein
MLGIICGLVLISEPLIVFYLEDRPATNSVTIPQYV